MGILLPPVSQVTNTRINMTQHHRNRSLDSALQRIPEVGTFRISSPRNQILIALCSAGRGIVAKCRIGKHPLYQLDPRRDHVHQDHPVVVDEPDQHADGGADAGGSRRGQRQQ